MFLRSFAYLSAVVLFSIPGYSDVLYTTGTSGIDNNSPGQWASMEVVAVPFSLQSEATIESVTVYAILYGSWDGTMNYDFFSESGYYPGSTLAQGAGQNVTTSVFYPIIGDMPVQAVTFNLASPETLNAGQYWLGVHMQASWSGYGEEWIAQDGDPGNVSNASSPGGTFNNWFLGGENNPFTLNGVLGVPATIPEPNYEPLLLIMSAACLIAGLTKRQRRSKASLA